MVDLTEETSVTLEDLKTWYELKEELARVKGAEAMLRSRIAKHFFPAPTEGSKDNKHPLNDGTGAILQMDYVINRTVDEQQLDALRSAIAEEGSNLPQLNLATLIRWKPEVVIGEYRKLNETERHTLDQCLIIKPGSPQLEIKIPKRPA
jgi:hypothetical protein